MNPEYDFDLLTAYEITLSKKNKKGEKIYIVSSKPLIGKMRHLVGPEYGGTHMGQIVNGRLERVIPIQSLMFAYKSKTEKK